MRPIRSFVLRQGRLSPAQARALDTLLPRYGIDYAPRALDFAAAFGRRAPAILEIGFGMGETTAAIAQAHPEHDFLGIEVHAPGVGALLREVEARALTNVRVVRHDAVDVVAHMIPPHSLAGVHVYFPDPWPKKRHHKRRLVDAAFAASAARVLETGGRLYAASDHPEYGPLILETFDAEPALRRLPAEETGDWRTGTDYERKALAARKPVWRGIWTPR